VLSLLFFGGNRILPLGTNFLISILVLLFDALAAWPYRRNRGHPPSSGFGGVRLIPAAPMPANRS